LVSANRLTANPRPSSLTTGNCALGPCRRLSRLAATYHTSGAGGALFAEAAGGAALLGGWALLAGALPAGWVNKSTPTAIGSDTANRGPSNHRRANLIM